MPPNLTNVFPRHLWALVVVYFVASLAHFVHNAEYIAYYPNMPAWITREKIYFAWLATNITIWSEAVAGLVLMTASALFLRTSNLS